MNVSRKPDLVLGSTYEPPQIAAKLRELAVRECQVGNIYLISPEELLGELINPEGPIHELKCGLVVLFIRLQDWNEPASPTVTMEGFEIVRRRCEILFQGVKRLSENPSARAVVTICESASLRSGAWPVARQTEKFESSIEKVCSALPRTTVIRVRSDETWSGMFMSAGQKELRQLSAVLGCYERA